MDIGQIPLFSLLAKRMAWLGRRQELLSQNIANVDTPDFRAKDLTDTRFKALLVAAGRPTPLAATHPDHLVAAPASHLAPVAGKIDMRRLDSDMRPVADGDGEADPVGNDVVLEDQLMKIGETAAEYELMTTLYRKHLNMIRIALGRGGG